MVKHISSIHRVVIDREIWADVIISQSNSLVKVTFSDKMISSTGGNITKILNFSSNTQDFTRDEFLIFLNKLHAYLTINPIARHSAY